MKQKKGVAGGKATAIKLRKEALDRYYSNPNICLFCHSIIEVNENQKIAEVRAKKFCNKSCSGKYNNSLREKKESIRYNCHICDIILSSKTDICKECRKDINFEKSLSITKGELFSNRKNYQSARSSIRKYATIVFEKENGYLKCFICDYDIHVEIAHKKSVSSFDDNSTLLEINNISNLIALCPNHHWEYDNGHLII